MDTARQLIRWSIPGAIYLLVIALSYFCYVILSWPSNTDLMCYLNDKLSTFKLTAPFLIALSIPTGFLIYQLYYWVYGNVFLYIFVSMDKGAIALQCCCQNYVLKLINIQSTFNEIERGVDRRFLYSRMYYRFSPLKDIIRKNRERRFVKFFCELYLKFLICLSLGIIKIIPRLYILKKKYRNKDGRRLFRIHFFGHWDMVRYAFKSKEIPDSLQEEYTAHFDIFHALGASRWAIVLALATFYFCVIFFPSIQNKISLNGWYIIFHIFICVVIIKIISSNRTATCYSIIALLSHIFATNANYKD